MKNYEYDFMQFEFETENVITTAIKLMLVLPKIITLHRIQEITLPDGSYGHNCFTCGGFEYDCKTIRLITEALNS